MLDEDSDIVVREDVGGVEVAEALEVQHLHNK